MPKGQLYAYQHGWSDFDVCVSFSAAAYIGGVIDATVVATVARLVVGRRVVRTCVSLHAKFDWRLVAPFLSASAAPHICKFGVVFKSCAIQISLQDDVGFRAKFDSSLISRDVSDLCLVR